MSLTRSKCSTEMRLLVVSVGGVGGTSIFTRTILFLYLSTPHAFCLFIVDTSIRRSLLPADLK